MPKGKRFLPNNKKTGEQGLTRKVLALVPLFNVVIRLLELIFKMLRK
jgi:hypothetical protein